MAYGVIYCLTDGINNKKYVGQTVDLKRRIKQHKRDNLYVDKAIRKHGWENFTAEVLEECDNREQLNGREIFWIITLNTKSPNGYNLTDGGEGMVRYSHTAETRAKISAPKKGRKFPSPSKETREKLSAVRKGKKRSRECCANISVGKRAKTHYVNLSKEITKHQLSYASLAKLMGVNASLISRKMLENRRNKFTDKDVIKLVEIFGLPAEYLMKRDDED